MMRIAASPFIVATMAVLLSGCAALENKIRENLLQAQELQQRCESLDEEVSVLGAEQLLNRIQKRLLLACSETGANGERDQACPFGLKAQLTDVKSWFGAQSVPPGVDAARKALVASSEAFDAAVNKMVSSVKASKNLNLPAQKMSAACSADGDRFTCNSALNALMRAAAVQLSGLDADGKSVRASFDATWNNWSALEVELRKAAPLMTEAGRQAASQVESVLASTQRTVFALGDAVVPELRS